MSGDCSAGTKFGAGDGDRTRDLELGKHIEGFGKLESIRKVLICIAGPNFP